MTRTSVGSRVRVNFYCGSQELDAAKKVAALKGTTYSDVIRVAVREYVIREFEKAQAGAKALKELTHE